MAIGTTVDWFPGTGLGSASTVLEYVAIVDSDTLQDNELIGKKLLTIAYNNECLTDFTGFPEFHFNSVTGTISGFPINGGERLVITFIKQ